MSTSRFSESQIVAILNQASSGAPVPELCRERAISNSTFCKRRSKYGGIDASMLRHMKELESENDSVPCPGVESSVIELALVDRPVSSIGCGRSCDCRHYGT